MFCLVPLVLHARLIETEGTYVHVLLWQLDVVVVGMLATKTPVVIFAW